MKQQTHQWDVLRVSTFPTNFHFWVNYSFNIVISNSTIFHTCEQYALLKCAYVNHNSLEIHALLFEINKAQYILPLKIIPQWVYKKHIYLTLYMKLLTLMSFYTHMLSNKPFHIFATAVFLKQPSYSDQTLQKLVWRTYIQLHTRNTCIFGLQNHWTLWRR